MMGSRSGRLGVLLAGALRGCVVMLALSVLFAAVAVTSQPARAAATSVGASAHPAVETLLYAESPCVPVYAAPNASSPLITLLLGGTDVTLVDSDTAGWSHVRIWSHTQGYTPASALGAAPPAKAEVNDCPFPGVPDPQPDVLPATNGPFTLHALGQTFTPTTLYAWPSATAVPVVGLAGGTLVTVSQWASDEANMPWYNVTVGAQIGWLPASAVALSEPNPTTHKVNGAFVWAPAAGKGMWFTNYLTRHADLDKLMADAKAAGITHVYAEVAISRWGFYGKNSLDRLLPAAHAHGIKVISWVYPTLTNVAADIRMTQQVADYSTPNGERADGIATDVEETIDSSSVYMYGQLLRGLFGPDVLLVDAALHPFTHANYPYAAVAASWNVLAPMNYWHSSRHHHYTTQDVASFVSSSVVTIRAAMQAAGVAHPIMIEELGQTYDMYSDDGAGVGHNPSGNEITTDLATAQSLGCIGASYFEWQTATQSQWTAFSSYRWN